MLLALHVLGGVDSLPLWWAWIVLLDGPHIFATLSRTYLDKRERETRGRLLLGSLGWFAAGPLAFALSLAPGRRLPFELFLAFAACGPTGTWCARALRPHGALPATT